MRIETADLITLQTAANLRGVSRQAMQDLVSRGKLQGIKIDTCVFVRRSDVEAYEPETAGRPRKPLEESKSKPRRKEKSA
jgi:hypothetical protein